jgi:hypothetical protein
MVIEVHTSMHVIEAVHIIVVHMAVDDPSIHIHIREAVIHIYIRDANMRPGALDPAAAPPACIVNSVPMPVAVIIQP